MLAAREGHVDAAALVMVDVTPNVEAAGVEWINAFMNQRHEGFDSLHEVAEAIATYQPHRNGRRNLEGLAKKVRLGTEGKYHWHWDPRSRERHWDPAERRARLDACARRVTVPTLLVRGGMSDLLPEEGAREFLALCPRAEYVNVTGAAHMVAGDRNDVFAGAVVEFFSRTVRNTERDGGGLQSGVVEG